MVLTVNEIRIPSDVLLGSRKRDIVDPNRIVGLIRNLRGSRVLGLLAYQN
jgi:hypothetical protein